MGLDERTFYMASVEALTESSKIIRHALLDPIALRAYEAKGDGTVVTTVDQESQEVSRSIIKGYFPDLTLNSEEGREQKQHSRIVLYHDPLDGTSSFLVGSASSTVILGAYDTQAKDLLAVATMEPSTGRFWYSVKGRGCEFSVWDFEKGNWDEKIPRTNLRVASTLQGARKSILVDTTRPYKKKVAEGKKQILTKNGRRELTNGIESLGGKETIIGTNGGSYALVATGRPTVMGHISTAIGGPYDIAGILHVKEAGGVAQCYTLEETVQGRTLQPLPHAQDIANADIAVAANNAESLNDLEKIVDAAVRKA